MLVLQQTLWPVGTALADTDDVTISSHEPTYTDPQPRTWESSTHHIAYCMNYEKVGPAPGQKYAPAHYATGGLGYIALHGYNNTTFIEGEELTQKEAQGATQYAYWIYNGSVDREGALLVPANGNPVGYVPRLRPRSERAWQAALRLVDAAKAFENDPTRNTPDALENTSSMVYKQDDGGTGSQEMVLVTVLSGNVDLTKDSTDPRTISSRDNKRSNYSLDGAVFKVWHDKYCTIDTKLFIRTDAYGKGTLFKYEYGAYCPAQLPLGTYYVRESEAPKGYKLDPTVYPIEIKRDQITPIKPSGEAVHEAPLTHSLTLTKTSDTPAITDGNPLYSLQGAVYGVWDNLEDAEDLKDAELASDPKALDGYWFLVHATANNEYTLDAHTDDNEVTLEHFSAKDEQKWYVAKNEDGTYSLKNGATNSYLSLDQQGEAATSSNASDSHWKLDAREGDTFSLTSGDGTSLAPEAGSITPGAKVESTDDADTQTGQWYLRRASSFKGSLTTDASGTGTLENLPDGDYFVREITAPQGYLPSSRVYAVTLDGANASLQAKDTPLVANGDVLAIKSAAGSGASPEYLPGAEFTVNYYAGSYDTLDDLPANPTRSWVITTNEQGVAGLTGGQDPSGNALVSGDEPYRDTKGQAVLPLGTITLRESKAPEGFAVSDPETHLQKITQTSGSAGNESTVAFTPLHVEDSRGQDGITIATTFTNKATASHVVSPTDATRLADTVAYAGLNPGQNYELKAVLVDKGTGKPLVIDGSMVTSSVTFTPSASSGSVEVPFECDAAKLTGKSIVAFEYLYQDGSELASHTDAGDANQTILFTEPVPEVEKTLKTTAHDALTGEAQAANSKEDALEDRVTYTGLTPGATYTLTTTLHARDSGGKDLGAVKDAQGKPISTSQDFVPEKSAGTIPSKVVLDTTPHAGRDLVFFETLTQNGAVVADHSNIGDAAQTIHVPLISTKAHNAQGGSDVAAANNVRFTDEVSYTNLLPGKQYTLTGKLMNKDTGKAVEQDGKPVTARVTFTPSQPSGTQVVEFETDTTQLAGTSVVVFETLSLNGTGIASHQDISDESQTISVPKIQTTLVDASSGEHATSPADATELVDHVAYSNLVPGTEYVLQGSLVNKATGEVLHDAQGDEVTVTQTFTPQESSGVEDVSFQLDTSKLAGQELVACEVLLRSGEVLYTHHDLKDAAQTITVGQPTTPDVPETPSSPASAPAEKPASAQSAPKVALPSTGDSRTDTIALVAIVGTVCLVMSRLEFPPQHRRRRR